jgi:hypothetical protein
MDKESNIITSSLYRGLAKALKALGPKGKEFASTLATKADDVELARKLQSQGEYSSEANRILNEERAKVLLGSGAVTGATLPFLLRGEEETPKVAMVKEAVSVAMVNKAFGNRVKRARMWNLIGRIRGVPEKKLTAYTARNARIPLRLSYLLEGVKSLTGQKTSKQYRNFIKALGGKTTGKNFKTMGDQSTALFTSALKREVDPATGNYMLRPEELRPTSWELPDGTTRVHIPSETGGAGYEMDLGRSYFGKHSPTTLIESLRPRQRILGQGEIDLEVPYARQQAKAFDEKKLQQMFQAKLDAGVDFEEAMRDTVTSAARELPKAEGMDLRQFGRTMRSLPEEFSAITSPGHEEVYGAYTGALGFTPLGKNVLGRSGGVSSKADDLIRGLAQLDTDASLVRANKAWRKGFEDRLGSLPQDVREKILTNLKKGKTAQEALADIDPFLKAKYLSDIQSAAGVPTAGRHFMNIRKNIRDVDVLNDLMIKLYNKNLDRIPEGSIPWIDDIERQFEAQKRIQKPWVKYRESKDISPFDPIVSRTQYGIPSRIRALQQAIPERIRPSILDETVEHITRQAREANRQSEDYLNIGL